MSYTPGVRGPGRPRGGRSRLRVLDERRQVQIRQAVVIVAQCTRNVSAASSLLGWARPRGQQDAGAGDASAPASVGYAATDHSDSP